MGSSTGRAVFRAASGPPRAVSARLTSAAGRGLALAGEEVLGQANEIVPIEEGDLARSGAVSVDQKGLRAAISYSEKYAVRQHEDLTLRHKNGRRAKYLESTITANKEATAEIIAAAIRGEF